MPAAPADPFRSLLLIAVLACAASLPAAEPIAPRMVFYGRFCGPDYPHITQGDLEEQRAAHRAIQPVDALDALCQQHDICYISPDRSRSGCDLVFSQQLHALRRALPAVDADDRLCRSIAGMMADFFDPDREDLLSGDADEWERWFEDLGDPLLRLVEDPTGHLRIYRSDAAPELGCDPAMEPPA